MGTAAYLLTNLPTGPYRLEVALQGFRTYVQTGIVLQVGGDADDQCGARRRHAGGIGHRRGGGAARRCRERGHQHGRRQRADLELPLQGRQVTDLIVLAGAAVQTGTCTSNRGVPGGVYISVAGGLPFGVAYTLDGAVHNNPQSNAGLPLPFPDALQEFQVATSGLSAQNGVQVGRVGQRRDQVGHQRVSRRRASSSCAIVASTRRSHLPRSAPTASRWTTA